MFHAPYGGKKPQENPVLQYWGVFEENKIKPIALFESSDMAVMFNEMMTDGKCCVRKFAFAPESTKALS